VGGREGTAEKGDSTIEREIDTEEKF